MGVLLVNQQFRTACIFFWSVFQWNVSYWCRVGWKTAIYWAFIFAFVASARDWLSANYAKILDHMLTVSFIRSNPRLVTMPLIYSSWIGLLTNIVGDGKGTDWTIKRGCGAWASVLQNQLTAIAATATVLYSISSLGTFTFLGVIMNIDTNEKRMFWLANVATFKRVYCAIMVDFLHDPTETTIGKSVSCLVFLLAQPSILTSY